MRIENVVLENINSLAGRFEIDLCDPAFSGGLFAIVGPSGAGKTTVLDAICLALYGKTPRVGTISDTQDELMNKNEACCKAEAVFSARGKRYKALFVHERSKGSRPFRAAKRELYEQHDDGWHVIAARIREMDEKIEEITGLDFGRFTRSIMLAQFRFAEFLQANSTERAAILEQITDMDIYRRLSVAVFEQTKHLKQELAATKARMGDIRVLAPEQEKMLADEQQQLAAHITDHTALSARLIECAGNVKRLDAMHSELATYKKAQMSLEKAVTDAQKEHDEAVKHQAAEQEAQEKLRVLLKEVRNLDENIQAQAKEVQHIDEKISDEKNQIREHKSIILGVFKKHFPEAGPEVYKNLYESAKAGEKLKQSAQAELNAATARVRQIRVQIENALMHKDEAYWQRRTAALRAAVPLYEAQEKAKVMQDEMAEWHKRKTELEAQSAEINSALRLEKERYEKALLEQRFGDERSSLKDGQPCPLCGAQHHPYAGKSAAQGAYAEAKKLCDAAVERQKQHLLNVAEAQTRIDDLNKRLEEKTRSINAQSEALEKLGGVEQTDTETLIKALAEAENVHTARAALQTKLDKATEDETALTIRAHSADSDAYTIETHRQFAQRLTQSTADREEERKKAQAVSEALRQQREALFGDRSADAEEEAASARVRAAQAHAETHREAAEQTRRDSDQNLADISRTQKGLAEHTVALSKAYAAAHEEALGINAVSEDAEVCALFEAWRQAALRLGDTADLGALEDAAKALGRLVSEEDARRGVIGEILRTNAESLSVLKKLKKEEATQDKAVRKWEKLNALIGSADGSRFSRIAQSITFDALLVHANMVLARLSDRYILVRGEAGLSKPLELAVADTYQAGEVRPVLNLSGGESFIVSLALALGLSEMSAGAARIDSLFIDEGFASLDEAYMEAALQTLCALGTREGKLIGVISHVEALKERIDVQLEVSKLPGGRAALRGPGVKAVFK